MLGTDIHLLISTRHYKELLACLEHFPGSATIPAVDGDLALHGVLRDTTAPEQLISEVLAVNTKALSHPGRGGDYPLHLAISSRCSTSLIASLISPEACAAAGSLGETALFSSLTASLPLSTLSLILAAHSPAAEIMDEMDNLPYHEARRAGAGEEVVEMLLEAYPEARGVENGDGEIV